MKQIGIAWALLTTVLFVFPPEIPTTSSNMNYAIVAFGIMLLIAGTTWVVDGRKNYKGPQLDIQGLLSGQVDGIDPTTAGDISKEGKPLEDMVERKKE